MKAQTLSAHVCCCAVDLPVLVVSKSDICRMRKGGCSFFIRQTPSGVTFVWHNMTSDSIFSFHSVEKGKDLLLIRFYFAQKLKIQLKIIATHNSFIFFKINTLIKSYCLCVIYLSYCFIFRGKKILSPA